MPRVVGVRFSPASKIYWFDPGETEDLHVGDYVIVDTARGEELGRIVEPPHDVPDETVVGTLKSVLRKAEPWDVIQADSFAAQAPEALEICKQKVAEHHLPMKLVRAEYNFDGSHLTFYFTAEHRVDFRNLVRDLAKAFKTRIELRQIGVRDEAKLMGGIGPCGREVCCSTWLTEFAPTSIKMAKQQDLPLNPTEISGICGRLLCCLSFENELYAEIRQRLPKLGAIIETPKGPGKVVAHNVLAGKVQVQLEDGTTFSMHPSGLEDLAHFLVESEPSAEAKRTTTADLSDWFGEREAFYAEEEESSPHPEAASKAQKPARKEREKPRPKQSTRKQKKSRRRDKGAGASKSG